MIKKLKVFDLKSKKWLNNYFESYAPYSFKNINIFFEGIIYNRKELFDYLSSINALDIPLNKLSDEKLISFLLLNFLKTNRFLKSIKKINEMIDGDYAFVIYDDEKIILVRDSIGMIPIYYHADNKFFAFSFNKKPILDYINSKNRINNDDNNSTISLNSSIKSLEPLNSFNSNNSHSNKKEENSLNLEEKFAFMFDERINTLKTGFIYDFNYNEYDIGINKSFKKLPWELNENQEKKISSMAKGKIKSNLKELLLKSFNKRINDLNEVALLFSAGVDSTILACLLKEKEINTTLYSVGTPNSQDLKFAKKFSKDFGFDLKIVDVNEKIIHESIKPICDAICDFNLMKIGVGMTIYLTTSLASDDGYEYALTGSGADELFGGYNRYLKNHFKDSNQEPNTLNEELRYDIANMAKLNLERDYEIAFLNDIQLISPFLDCDLVDFALNIPPCYKINNIEDDLRKRILREIAADLNVPSYIANRPKKAAQYGSGIDKILKKKLLKKDMNGNIVFNYDFLKL